MKTCIATLTVGEFYEKLASTSHETFRAYAEKIDADFVVRQHLTTQVPGYSKFAFIRELLEKYDRVAFIDTDILIRHDAPSLFELVPEDAFGAFNEGQLFPQRAQAKASWCKQTSILAPPAWLSNNVYFNTGVLVVSRQHSRLFAEAADEHDNFGEQTCLNHRLFVTKTPTFHLPHRFNRVIGTLRASGEQLDDSFLVHFAGAFAEGSPVEENYVAWLACAERFAKYRRDGAVPVFRKRLYIEMAGALGDIVATEPVVRYLRKVIEPDAEIVIKTEFPPVLAHIADHPHTKILGQGETTPDKGHLKMYLFPEPPIANYNLMPPIDYAALAAFRGQVPKAHRHIQLQVNSEAPHDLSNHVLVHAGKSWQSKTFPVAWWNEVIRRLKEKAPVALIGKTYQGDDFRGTVDVDARGCLDLRNKTKLGELFACIRDARVLVSNDSSPVHIAGAFITPVVMITSAKHADFIWPHRDPSLNITLGRPIKAAQAAVGIVNNIYMHECDPAELESVLPEPIEVVEKAMSAYHMGVQACRSIQHSRQSQHR